MFSLLPKAFQRHPELDYHVICEMTAAGRRLPQPTAQHPVYYIEQAGKFTQLGNNTPANEHAPDVTHLTRAMEHALAASNYRRATPSTPVPALAIVFNYGSFARFSTADYDLEQMVTMEQINESTDPENASAPFMQTSNDRDPDALLPMVLANPVDRKDVIERAELIGGETFARQLATALNQEALYQQSHTMDLLPGMRSTSPFHQFVNANTKLMTLVDESFSSCYFVVASAYDYVAMRKGQRVLLWRTKMTVNSTGISMSESLPSLVISAGPYFGRDMTESVTLARKISREGNVEVGTPEVIDYSAPPPSPPSSGNK